MTDGFPSQKASNAASVGPMLVQRWHTTIGITLCQRWPNVSVPTLGRRWHNVGVQPLGQRWANWQIHVGPTLVSRRWPNVRVDVGPTLGQRRNASWDTPCYDEMLYVIVLYIMEPSWRQLFVQKLVQTNIKDHAKDRNTCPLWREFTGHRLVLFTRDQ